MNSIVGTLLASLTIGIADVASKYYLPSAGGVLIYLVTVLAMLWRPNGLMGRKLSHD